MAMLTEAIMSRSHRTIMDILNLFITIIEDMSRNIQEAQRYNAMTEEWQDLRKACKTYMTEIDRTEGATAMECPVDIDARDIWADAYTQSLLTQKLHASYPPIAHAWISTENGMALFTDAQARQRVNDIKVEFFKTQSVDARMTFDALKKANMGKEFTIVQNVSPVALKRVEQVCKAHMFEFAAKPDEAGNYNIYFPTDKMIGSAQLAKELEKAIIMGSHGIGAARENILNLHAKSADIIASATGKNASEVAEELKKYKGDAREVMAEFGDVEYVIDTANPSKYIEVRPNQITFCFTHTSVDGSTQMYRNVMSPSDEAKVKMHKEISKMKAPKTMKGYEWCNWCLQNDKSPASFYSTDTLFAFAKQGYRVQGRQLSVATLQTVMPTLSPEAQKELGNILKQQMLDNAGKINMPAEDISELKQEIRRLSKDELSALMQTDKEARLAIDSLHGSHIVSQQAEVIDAALQSTVNKLIGIEGRVAIALNSFSIPEIQRLTSQQMQTVLKSAGIKDALATQIAENYIKEIQAADLDTAKYRETQRVAENNRGDGLAEEILGAEKIPESQYAEVNNAIPLEDQEKDSGNRKDGHR